MKQEILDDLVRLELVHTKNKATDRWLLIAGQKQHLDAKVFKASFNIGGGRSFFSTAVLPVTTNILNINIDGSKSPWRDAWKDTPAVAASPALRKWPSGMKIQLLAQYPRNPAKNEVACFIWKVSRVQNRKETSLP